MVVEDGVEESGSQPRSRPQWILVVVSVSLGFAMGTLVTADPDPGEEVPTTMTSVVDEPAVPESAGISAVIPDFPDSIVAVGGGIGAGFGGFGHQVRGVEVWQWPSDGPLVTRGLTDGENVRFDATGQFVALTEPIPGLPGFLLSTGRFNRIRAVRAGVTSFAWHDSRSGVVAYTARDDGRWQSRSENPRARDRAGRPVRDRNGDRLGGVGVCHPDRGRSGGPDKSGGRVQGL